MKSEEHIVVLGAGVVGVTTAWYLCQAGYKVTVIDRQADVALETSKANGGQISVSHAEPWANPKAPTQALKWLFNTKAPLRYYPSLNTSQLSWVYHFLKQCSTSNSINNTIKLIELGKYSRTCLQQLRDTLNLNYQQKQRGILHFYTDSKMFESAKKSTALFQQAGCERHILSKNEAISLDSALAQIKGMIGATYTKADESGNAHEFTKLLADACKEQGVNFIFNAHIQPLSITTNTNKITALRYTSNNEAFTLTANKFVVCLGSYSRDIVKPLNIHLNIYPAKGYSATYKVLAAANIPQTSLIDDSHKLVFSRFNTSTTDVFRVAGMAEIQSGKNKFDLTLNPNRANLITERVSELFPEGLDFSQPNYWTGLRPATPSNLPYICKTNIDNLFLNTGHGTLGWTHACGSAQHITHIIQDKTTDIFL